MSQQESSATARVRDTGLLVAAQEEMRSQKRILVHVANRAPGKAILAFVIVLLISSVARAQNEFNNWIFGHQVGLSFATGTPIPYPPSPLPQILTHEGSASISDQAGNLLFYTDGLTVWDNNNVTMANGAGLLGGNSATQSAVIVPWPGTCKYFVFTVSSVNDPPPYQLHYSIVDLTTPPGVVVSKNTWLRTWVAEKLAAVADDTGTGFWVIAHQFDPAAVPTLTDPVINDEFYAYHIQAINPNGINTSPVISPAGSPHTSPGSPLQASGGQMKVSPDGRLIACAVRDRFAEVLGFNTNNGVVSGLPTTFNAVSPLFQTNAVYGIEFSPLSQYLYVSTQSGALSQVIQFDLVGTQAPVNLPIPPPTPSWAPKDVGALQLGPDNRIYAARYQQKNINVINAPDSPGTACLFTLGPQLPAGPRTCRLGLPAMISGTFNFSRICGGSSCDFAVSPACPGQATTFTPLGTNATSWNWNFGDTHTSSQSNPTNVYAASGNYTVTLTVGNVTCTKVITIPAAPLPPVIYLNGVSTLNSPPTTCQPGTYSVVAPHGMTVSWAVTNGTPASGSGQNITVSWNPSGNGFLVVTLTNGECCKTTAQLLVTECPRPPCCSGVSIGVSTPKPTYDFCPPTPGYVLTPTLTVSGLGNITQVTADILSASLSYPIACGVSGPVVASFASPTSENGFTATLNNGELVWTSTSSSGVPFPLAGVTFNLIKIVLPPPHPTCSYMLSLCIKYTFTDDKCVTCSIIKCVTFDLQPSRPSNPSSC